MLCEFPKRKTNYEQLNISILRYIYTYQSGSILKFLLKKNYFKSSKSAEKKNQRSFVLLYYLLSSQISKRILYAEKQFKKNDTLSINSI